MILDLQVYPLRGIRVCAMPFFCPCYITLRDTLDIAIRLSFLFCLTQSHNTRNSPCYALEKEGVL